MSGWTIKRFWTEARVEPAPGGLAILLDARPVRTPAKAPLVVPTRAMADAIAAEWQAQVEAIDPRKMPVTRSANAAIDKVTPQHSEVAELIADYGATDLLCYRAEGPEPLARRQAARWDPVLVRLAETYGPLSVTSGIVPVTQPAPTLMALRSRVAACSAFELTALHDLVSISGSLGLGIAVAEGWIAPDEAWALSRIDEDWLSEQWGEDDEAARAAALKAADFAHAAHFWQISQPETD